MRISRFMMVIAAACFIASSLTEAQGRGHRPAGRVPQTATTGNSGVNVGGRTGGGYAGNAGVTPRESGGRPGKAGTTPGDSGSRGGKAGSAGGGTAGEGRGNGGHANKGGEGNGNGGHPKDAGKGNGNGGHPNNKGEDRGNADGRGDTGNDQDAPGRGPRRGDSDKEHRASFVAKMNPKQRARIEVMLPSGLTFEQAADGFRSKGQFVAALQQSHRHHVSFVDLKAQMTGDNPLSLGQAMRKLAVQTEED